jgi:WD40 repeat protein
MALPVPKPGQQEKLFGHSEIVTCLAYSPDGTLLASGSLDFTVKLWNPQSGALITTCAGHTNNVISVDFSPDGRFMASTQDGLVCLWDVSTWQIVLTFTNRRPRVAFSGKLLGVATGGDSYGDGEGVVKFWDYAAGHEIKRLQVPVPAWHSLMENGSHCERGQLVKLEPSDRADNQIFPATQVRVLAFSRIVVRGRGRRELRLWKLMEEESPCSCPMATKAMLSASHFQLTGRPLPR